MIRNNIFANNMKAQLQATRVEEHLSFTFSNNIVWFSSGDLFFSNWPNVNMKADSNCYWNTEVKDFPFGKFSFAAWKESGKDRHSVIADPGFVNPADGNFEIRNKKVLPRIGFKVFNYSKAGVYGSEDWKKLAEFDPGTAARFEEAVRKNEQRRH
ncbi:MAG: DUF5123 domain-containing protein [Mangrovibacterium sp.]